jgi:hypothetical protein
MYFDPQNPPNKTKTEGTWIGWCETAKVPDIFKFSPFFQASWNVRWGSGRRRSGGLVLARKCINIKLNVKCSLVYLDLFTELEYRHPFEKYSSFFNFF